MKINTCEQYVLAELNDATERIYEISAALEDAEREIAELREKSKPSNTEQIIAAAGRKALFIKCFRNYVDVKDGDMPVPFKDWCLDSIYQHSLPNGLSKLDFIDAFEPEFREKYNEAINEEC